MRSILYVLVVVGIFACGGAWLANQKFDNDVQARARAAQAAAPEYVKNLERSESARKGCVHMRNMRFSDMTPNDLAALRACEALGL